MIMIELSSRLDRNYYNYFNFNSYIYFVLMFPFSCKIVSRWHRFNVSFKLQGCLTMASFCCFLSVARLSHDGIVLMFPLSCKVVSRWHCFVVSFQLQGCLTMVSFSCFLSVARLSHDGILLLFPFSCKVVSRWHRFGVSFQLQGCLTMASLLEMFIGFIGGVGFLIRFIGPISIAPTIFLIGMSLAPVVSELCATQWWIAIM